MIQIRTLSQYYAMEHCALHIDALDLPDGEVIGLFGANGAGKSTLLRLLAGIEAPTWGDVRIDGLPPVQRLDALAYASEAGTVPPFLSARAYRVFLADLWPHFDPDYYDTLLHFFDLPADRPAGQLSRGQRSKLELAAAAARRAPYLLLDEPFAGEDLFTRRDLMKLLLSGLRGGETIVLATHQLGEIDCALDRAIILQDGSVIANLELETLRATGESLTDCMARLTGYDPTRIQRLNAAAPT